MVDKGIIDEDNIVIVLNTENYKSSYSEPVPFKAKVYDKYDFQLCVKSLVTGKEYELYDYQILECLKIEYIKKMLDVSKYGME